MNKTLLLAILFSLSTLSVRSQNSSEEAVAMQFVQGGEYDKALPIYRKLYQSSPAGYYDQYFSILLRLKKFDEAEKLLKNLLKSNPQNLTYQIDFGRILQERGQPEKAKNWYGELIDRLPKDEFQIRELATTFYRAEAYDFSIKTLLRGRELLQDESAFAFELISLYRFQKNKDMLVQEYLKELNKKPELRSQAQNILSSIFEGPEDYESLKRMLIPGIRKNPQNFTFEEMLSWVYLQQKQYSLALRQTIALDKRMKENGERVYELAYTLIADKAFREAAEALDYIVQKGKNHSYYIPSRIQLLNIKYELLESEVPDAEKAKQLEKEYESFLGEFGKSQHTVSALRKLAALKGYHLNKAQEAAGLMETILKVPGLPPSAIGQAKLELGDYYVLNDEIWEATLMYGQVEKQFADQPLGHEAKFKNAKVSYYRGDLTWAKAQLDVLKSSTSQLIANDALNLSIVIAENSNTTADSNALRAYAGAEFLEFKKRHEEALEALNAIDKEFPGNSLADDILMSKAKIYLEQNKLSEAQEQLQLIIDNYGYDLWADDALFLLAEMMEKRLKNRGKAQELYQKLINDFPGSYYVNEARIRFRNLRGDKID